MSYQPKQPPRNILIVMPSWVGDVAMATPFVRALVSHFSDAKVTLLLRPHLAGVVQDCQWAQNILLWKRGKDPTAKAAQRELHRTLRNARFELAVLLPNSFSAAWLAFRTGARARIGFNRDGRGLLLTHRVPVPNKSADGYEPMPLVEYYAVLAEYLGMPAPGDQIELNTANSEDAAVNQRLADAGIQPTTPLVVICPGANFGASKCWHPERFAAVADKLAGEQNCAITISPGPGEEPLAEAICKHMQQPALLLSEPCLTLGELKSLVKRANLLLGNDTGPRHFARAFEVPRVTVFGPTFARWTDTSHDKEIIVQEDVPCGPCHQKVCPKPARICMDRVEVPRVYAASVEMLKLKSI